MLTTDGVHSHVDDLAPLLTEAASPQEVADAVAKAVSEAGEPDNYTTVVARSGLSELQRVGWIPGAAGRREVLGEVVSDGVSRTNSTPWPMPRAAAPPYADERTSKGAAIDSSCLTPIMDFMEDQQAPQSAEGEAKVITLCGSTKFEAEFAEVNQRLTMEGCVVISLGMFSLPDLPDYDWTADSSGLKGRLDAVHFQKIRMADEVYIVDPGGYVGESTRREIAYAESLGKPVRYLSRERLARTGDGPQE